jgi:hypothetical protein
MYEGIVAPTSLCGSKVWATGAAERRRMEVMEIVRAMCGINIMDIVRNEYVRRQCGSEVGIGESMDRNMFRLYGHVERMKEEIIVKRVYIAKVECSRARARPKMRWMGSVERNERRRG